MKVGCVGLGLAVFDPSGKNHKHWVKYADDLTETKKGQKVKRTQGRQAMPKGIRARIGDLAVAYFKHRHPSRVVGNPPTELGGGIHSHRELCLMVGREGRNAVVRSFRADGFSESVLPAHRVLRARLRKPIEGFNLAELERDWRAGRDSVVEVMRRPADRVRSRR